MTAFIHGPERLDDIGDAKPPPHAEKATYQNAFDELQNFLASIEQEVGWNFPRVPCIAWVTYSLALGQAYLHQRAHLIHP